MAEYGHEQIGRFWYALAAPRRCEVLAQNEPYLRAEWRMAITESDGWLGQFGAWASHRRRQSRHGRARTGVSWQAHACAACAAGFTAILESPEQGKHAASNRIQPA
jgi:hypothetical protein